MNDDLRLFIALEPAEELKSALARWRGVLPSAARSTPQEQYHLTLVFLGGTPPEAAERLAAEFAAAFDGSSAAQLIPDGFGCFPSRSRPNSLHLAFKAEPELLELKRRADTLVGRITGKPADNRRFMPHITLLRFKSRLSAEDSEKLERLTKMRCPATMARKIVLFHSHNNTGRLIHTPLALVELPGTRPST
ncbi:MAG: RNA 2',3'-cyclic phosphodiesterase [Victivallaceae bacterium]|nr:RNA 2',3'-cyclic phosphodiesterase [Victivallaceae bacterium]